jgi:hypothetical protein
LRAKAADPVVPETERRALLERAADIERRHPEIVTVKSRFTDNTSTTSRDGFYSPFTEASDPWGYDAYTSHGRTRFTKPNPKPGEDPNFDRRTKDAWDELYRLFQHQHQWNKPPQPDADDLISDEFKYDPGPGDDEDYGYDIYEGEDYE